MVFLGDVKVLCFIDPIPGEGLVRENLDLFF